MDAETLTMLYKELAKLDSPTGVGLFIYMSYQFKRFESKMEELNKKLETVCSRVVKLEETVEDWLFTE